ncbi:phage tail tape measure protein [Pseudomonas mosselii]|uniref:phage tail tape measure protein n=1 Tax=Pseudomonas mosselii TaxID=78327 RepID=UPI002163036C|nr:phage tail tape measure protein [Pseudomonas mosselii]UVN46244.1 phage tail tape measure protein [Pseudomonas mosselii]
MADKFQLKALITGVDKLSPVLTGVRKNVATLRKQLNASGLGKITFADALQGGALAAPFVMGVKAAISFESAMADVKKVVNFETPEQFQAMNKDVLDLSERLPMAADGIAAIVAAGGQSGIAREELGKFAEDAVKMGVAFDQTAAESGEMMAKWRTAFRMGQTDVVALADQINYLGNTGPASTKQISSIITEVGALGEVAGLSSAQVAAIGATMAGVGVKQDVAATGIKNFMLAMTKGSAATKSQAEAFKALRLDSKQVAEAMQKDSQGTMLDLLKRISQVDAAKRPALLTNLFGSESIAAITPLVTNLQLLTSNLTKVGDSTQYAGSMEAEYASRAATTANAMQLLQNRLTRLGISVGSILLPPFNDFLAFVGPLVSDVAALAAAHPGLIKGILGAAVGFTALRLATAAATVALAVMNGVATMSPIGMIVRVIALAAGFLIANWETVGPFFEALWELIKAYTVPAWELFKTVAAWTPLGLIIKNWEPIVGFFKGLWEKVSKFIEPMMKFMGLDGDGEDGEGITVKVQRAAYAQNVRNGEALGAGDGALLAADAGKQAAASAAAQQQVLNAQLGIPATASLLKAPAPGSLVAGGSNSLLRAPGPVPGSLVQQAAQGQRQNLEGSIAVRFENAPPGMRVEEAKTNQPGVSIPQNVGYRSLAR